MSFIQSPFDARLADLLSTTALPGRAAARSAVRHIDRSAVIADIDEQMAAFRAITAEEESATAVMYAIKRHAYPGHEYLNVRDHVHKNALSPFLTAVGEVIAIADSQFDLRAQLVIDGEGEDAKVTHRFHTGRMGLGDQYATPIPPLELRIGKGEQVHDFGAELQKVVGARRADSIKSMLLTRANLRNQLIYASKDGLPEVQLNGFLAEQRRIVRRNLIVFLMIDPYAEHQTLVMQSVAAFLKMLGPRGRRTRGSSNGVEGGAS